MNIGIDIDDTIADTTKEIDICAKIYTENVLKREFKLNELKIKSFDPMWAKQVYNWSLEEDKNFWDLYYVKINQNVKPKKDAIDTINELYNDNKIIIISARYETGKDEIFKITEQWLNKYKIKYHKLFIASKDKCDIVKENQIDLFIDDSYKTCRAISNMHVRTMIMDSRINTYMLDDDIERVFSWKDIKSKI